MKSNVLYRPKVLIAEPDVMLREQLVLHFANSGFECNTASNGEQALQLAKIIIPNLLLMEVTLPKMDGIEVCKELKLIHELEKMLVVFYTERSEDYSQIAAFNAGADDYVIKPMKSNLLLLRINTLMKRSMQTPEMVSFHLNDKSFIIDRERYCVMKDGVEIVLPRKEFELLSLLFSKPQKVFTRTDISDKIWGYKMSHKNRTIDVHIRKLREKLGDRHIKTVKGIGYSFEL